MFVFEAICVAHCLKLVVETRTATPARTKIFCMLLIWNFSVSMYATFFIYSKSQFKPPFSVECLKAFFITERIVYSGRLHLKNRKVKDGFFKFCH